MGKRKQKNVNDIKLQAKKGSSIAREELLMLSYELIEMKATYAYQEIIKILKSETGINYSNIIEYDDIKQDLTLKSLIILDQYLSKEKNIYFSAYLSHLLSSYINTYISRIVKEITSKNQNEVNVNLNFQYNELLNTNNEEQEKVLDIVSNDKILVRYKDFISTIFEEKIDENIAGKTGLNDRQIYNKTKSFLELYFKRNENPVKKYITSEELLVDIKNGDLFKIKYFNKDIIFTLHDIFSRLNKKYSVSYNIIKEDFCTQLYNFLKNNYSYICNLKIDDIELSFKNILKLVSSSYYSFKDSDLKEIAKGNWHTYIYNENIITEEEVFSLIEKGKICEISPYKEYIDMYIQNIYENIMKEGYIDYSQLNRSIISMIDRIIDKYMRTNIFPLEDFNKYLKNKLLNKRNHYLDNLESTDKKILEKKK